MIHKVAVLCSHYKTNMYCYFYRSRIDWLGIIGRMPLH